MKVRILYTNTVSLGACIFKDFPIIITLTNFACIDTFGFILVVWFTESRVQFLDASSHIFEPNTEWWLCSISKVNFPVLTYCALLIASNSFHSFIHSLIHSLIFTGHLPSARHCVRWWGFKIINKWLLCLRYLEFRQGEKIILKWD